MRIGHVELFVRDPERARRFYAEVLGFEVTDVQAGGRVTWLRSGDALLLLRPGAPRDGGRDYASADAAIVLYTDDLPAERRRLEERGLAFRGDDGPDCPTFTDPDGHWFQLVDPSGH